MNKKIGTILVCFLLSSVILLVVNNEFNVEATWGRGSNGPGEDNGINLVLDYMYNVTLDLASVVHNDSIWDTGIRKGRDFGTEGDQWTAEYIYKQMKYNLINNLTKLENVTKIKIEPIDGMKDWDYNYKVDAIDFKLTINGDGYPFPHTVPKNETYAQSTGTNNRVPGIPGWGKMDYNHTFNNLLIVPKNLSTGLLKCEKSYINVSCNSVKEIDDIIGNATYIPIGENLPEDQEYRIFLLEEEQGVEDQLDNITNNMSAVILIHNYSMEDQDQYYANTQNYNFSIGRVSNNDSNLMTVIEMLQNGTLMIADNYFNGKETFTFTYEFTCDDWPWGSDDFFYVSGHPLYNYGDDFYNNTILIAVRNYYENFFPMVVVLYVVVLSHMIFPIRLI